MGSSSPSASPALTAVPIAPEPTAPSAAQNPSPEVQLTLKERMIVDLETAIAASEVREDPENFCMKMKLFLHSSERAETKRTMAKYVIDRIKDIENWNASSAQVTSHGNTLPNRVMAARTTIVRMGALKDLLAHAIKGESDLNSVWESIKHRRFPGGHGLIYDALVSCQKEVNRYWHVLRENIASDPELMSHLLPANYPEGREQALLAHEQRHLLQFFDFDYKTGAAPVLPEFRSPEDDAALAVPDDAAASEVPDDDAASEVPPADFLPAYNDDGAGVRVKAGGATITVNVPRSRR